MKGSSAVSSRSEYLIELERKHSANNYAPLPVVLNRGSGALLFDVNDRSYLDFTAGCSSVNFGHCHPAITEALVKQAHQLCITSRSFVTSNYSEFAEKITSLFNYDKVIAMNTGTEACETAVKIARKWGYRVKGIPMDEALIIFVEGNFWGRTLAAISTSSDKIATSEFGPFMPGFKVIPYDDLSALSEALTESAVCAFMVEPIQAAGGVRIPKTDYIKEAYSLCQKQNILFIADEIHTGLGRCGSKTLSEKRGVKPDLMILGKSLGGGSIPISAVLGDKSILGLFKPGTHGSTFGGNPLASKVALQVLELLANDFDYNSIDKKGMIFIEGFSNQPIRVVKEVRGEGLLMAIEFESDLKFTARELSIKLLDYGVLARSIGDSILRLEPPLCIEDAQLKEGADLIMKAIEDLS